MKSINDENYTVTLDEANSVININGILRLSGNAEYQPIIDLLNELLESKSETLTINVEKLDFLNSSGIAMLSKFMISARSRENTSIVINGSNQIPWQAKSLKNLQRLLPSLELNFN